MVAGIFLLALLTYSHMGEDAYISFRYARHLAQGHGLVFNPGEYVEGYSNLLWVLLMAPFEWLGLRIDIAARVASTASLAALAVCGWWAARHLAGDRFPTWLRWWLPAALAVEPLLHYHDDRGLETVFHAALLGGAMMVAGCGGRAWVAGLLAGLAALTRPEGIGFALCVAPAFLFNVPGRPLRRPRDLLVFLAIAFGLFAAQVIFRKLYYGAYIPNTMVAKRPAGSGLLPIMALTASHAFIPLFGLAGACWAMTSRRLRSMAAGTLAMMAGAALFQMRAGALLNESFRYLVPMLVPALVGTWLLVMRLAEQLQMDRERAAAVPVVAPVAAVLFAAVPTMIFSSGPAGLYFRGNGDAPRSRIIQRLAERPTWDIPERVRWFLHDELYINAEAARWSAANLPPDALIGADQVGQFGYHLAPKQRVLDLLGLMDKRIAREGLTVAYLKERAPEYLVVESLRDSTFWPREWRHLPSVWSLRPVFAEPGFQDLYRPRWFLESPVSFIQVGFMVYIRRDLDDGMPIETVPIGVDEEAFERWWRVR